MQRIEFVLPRCLTNDSTNAAARGEAAFRLVLAAANKNAASPSHGHALDAAGTLMAMVLLLIANV